MSNLDALRYGNQPQAHTSQSRYARPQQGSNRMGQYTPPSSQSLQSGWDIGMRDFMKHGGGEMLDYSPTGSNQQNYSIGKWNPSQQQKTDIASGTWDLYKGSGGDWITNPGNPFEIRGVDRGDDANDYVDFYWRNAGDTGQGQQYGTLSGLAWNNPDTNGWQANEANSFWSAGSPQFGNWWGEGLGLNRTGQQGLTPAGSSPINSPAGIYPDQGGSTLPGGGWRFPGLGNQPAVSPEQAIQIGMGGATGAYQNMLNTPQYYPDWWGDEYQRLDAAKWQNAYPEFLAVPEYQGVQAPGPYQKIDFNTQYQGIDPSQYKDYQMVDPVARYQGLMEGDYDKLEKALTTPGEIAAQRGFEQGGDYLKNIMGANGMYGSSMMGQQANEQLNQGYMDSLATNAANAVAQRYGMQQGDLQFGSNFDLNRANQQIGQNQFDSQLNMNQLAQQMADNQFGANFGLNQNMQRMGQNQFDANYGLQNADFQRQNALDKYNSAMTSRNLLNDYNNQRFQFDYGLGEAGRQENNNLLQNRFQYDLASQDWRNALNERYMNAGLSLAGMGAPIQSSQWGYENQQRAYDDAQNSNYWGMGLDLFDRIGGFDYASNSLGSIFDSFFKSKG